MRTLARWGLLGRSRDGSPRRAGGGGALRKTPPAAVLLVLPLLAAACGIGHGYRHIPKDSAFIIGTTDHVSSLDPATSYESASFALYSQIYPFLLNFPYGKSSLAPDAAEHCDFAEPTRFRCVLKPKLTFANGHPLTSRSVKFSFDRIFAIKDPDGPISLLGNLARVEAPDERTVDFILKTGNDQTFPQVLAVNPGPILDERVFPADRAISDAQIVAAQPFAGPYTIATYHKNDLVLLQARKDYRGLYEHPATSHVVFKYYANQVNLKLDLVEHHVDMAYHTLSVSDFEELRHNAGVRVWSGAVGEMRYLGFNRAAQPGQTEAQKLAVRKAVAASVDREALSREVYHGQYQPAWSVVPSLFPASVPAFKEAYGARPDKAKAAGYLRAAGVQTPVTLRLQYTPEHYGSASSEEYALIKGQLESTGLFRAELQATEWNTFVTERGKGSYPMFQAGWFPDFSDPDTYLTPFFVDNNNLNNGFSSPALARLLNSEVSDPDPASRAASLAAAQRDAANDLVSIIPLLTGIQMVATGVTVAGVPDAVEGAFKLRVGALKTTGGGAA